MIWLTRGVFPRVFKSRADVEVASVSQRFSQSRRRFRTLCLVVAALLVTLLAVPCHRLAIAAGQAPGVANEYDLKLARLFATSKFIAWPDEAAGAKTPFVIGVIDPDPFRGGLQKLTTRKLKDRPIRVVILKSVADYEACHLLFIPTEAKPEIVDAILKQTANQPVLVWRDEADPLKTTGVSCTFVQQGDALMIEADPTELKRRNLSPDGRLLSLNIVRIVKSTK